MRTICLVFVVSAMVLSAPLSWAQRPQGRGGFGGGLFLLNQESVQKELGLSEDQIKQVDELLAEQREAFSGLRDLGREERQQKLAAAAKASQAALASVLNDDQQKRFRQISLQQRGPAALADPGVSAELDLTDEQKSRLGEIQSAARDDMRSLFQGADGGDRQEIRKKFQEAQAAVNKKLLGVLTPEQQTKWNEITGKPFTGEVRSRFRRGDRGGSGAPGNRRRNRNADSTEASTGSNEPVTVGWFRLASFRAADADDKDVNDKDSDDAKASDTKSKKKPGAKKAKGHKPRSPQAKGPSPEARRRAHRPPAEFGRSDGSRGKRDRAWGHVARVMRERGYRPRRTSMTRRGPGRGFAHGPHRGHGRHMAWGGHPSFGGPHHRARYAGFHRHRGHRPQAFGWAQGRRFAGHDLARFARHRGPKMAHHRGPDRHGDRTMAHAGRYRGHHDREMARRPMHHGRHHAMHGGHHHGHGPRASFASHRGRGPMHMAGFHRHRPGGHAMGKHRGHDGDKSSSGSRHGRERDDRDDMRKRDRSDHDRDRGHRDDDRDDGDRDDD